MRLARRPVVGPWPSSPPPGGGVLNPAHPSAQNGAGRRAVTASDARDVRAWDAQITRMLARRPAAVARRGGRSAAGRPQPRAPRPVPPGGQGVRRRTGPAGRRGQTVSVFGSLYTGIRIDAEPTLSPQDAAGIVAELTGAPWARKLAPELVVLPETRAGTCSPIALRVLTATTTSPSFFVDAGTGELVLRYSDLQTTIGTGQGVLNDTKKVSTTRAHGHVPRDRRHAAAGHLHLRPQGQPRADPAYLNGWLTLNTGRGRRRRQPVDRPAAVDAHAYAGWTYDYLYKRFNRQGLDNRNLTMTSIVHPVRREDWASAVAVGAEPLLPQRLLRRPRASWSTAKGSRRRHHGRPSVELLLGGDRRGGPRAGARRHRSTPPASSTATSPAR